MRGYAFLGGIHDALRQCAGAYIQSRFRNVGNRVAGRTNQGLHTMPVRIDQPRAATVNDVQVWKVRTGQVLRRYDKAHPEGVTALCFGRDGSQLLSGSFDTTLK